VALTVDWIARCQWRQAPVDRDVHQAAEQVVRSQQFSARETLGDPTREMAVAVRPERTQASATEKIQNLAVDVLWTTLVAHSRRPLVHDTDCFCSSEGSGGGGGGGHDSRGGSGIRVGGGSGGTATSMGSVVSGDVTVSAERQVVATRGCCAWVRVLIENVGRCTQRIATWRIARLFRVAETRVEACAVEIGDFGRKTPRALDRLRTTFELLAALGCISAQHHRWRDAVGQLRVICNARMWEFLCPTEATATTATATTATATPRLTKTSVPPAKRLRRTGGAIKHRGNRERGGAWPPGTNREVTATEPADEKGEEEARMRRVLVVRLAHATVHCLDALHAIGADREMLAVARHSATLPERLRRVHGLTGDPGANGDAEGDRVWPVCALWHRRLSERLAAAHWWVSYRRGALGNGPGPGPGTEPPQGRPKFSVRRDEAAGGGGGGFCGGGSWGGGSWGEASGGAADAEAPDDGDCVSQSPLIRSVCAEFKRLDRAAAAAAAAAVKRSDKVQAATRPAFPSAVAPPPPSPSPPPRRR
jgi:uncharacterized membrane protein YgcG